MGILNCILRVLQIVFSIMFSILVSSCGKDNILSFNRQDFVGNNLRTDGYYYYFSDKLFDKISGKEYYYFKVFFNYKNGLHFAAMQGPYDHLMELDLRIKKIDNDLNSIISRNNFNYKLHWGVFNVSGSAIEIDRWTDSSGGGAYPTEILKGNIVGDATIKFHTKLAAEPLVVNGKKKTLMTTGD